MGTGYFHLRNGTKEEEQVCSSFRGPAMSENPTTPRGKESHVAQPLAPTAASTARTRPEDSDQRQPDSIAALPERFVPTQTQQGDGEPLPLPSPSVMPELPGYEVREKLGEGGMGAVYRAFNLGLKREEAIKQIRAQAFASALDREMFRREAEAVARVRHPNIVQIYRVGEA